MMAIASCPAARVRRTAIALLDRNRARPRWPSSGLLAGPSASLSVNNPCIEGAAFTAQPAGRTATYLRRPAREVGTHGVETAAMMLPRHGAWALWGS
jgi:hypothetical protein